MKMDRRNFLRVSSLVTGSMLVPKFLKAFDGHLPQANGKVLVVIQLSGGNDGLNTVVPFRNDIYYKLRPGLAINSGEVLSLNGEMGFHPQLTGLKELYDQGWLTVINNVGYPNPNRSHFRSMDIWHSGSNAEENWSSGWLGRYLDAACRGGKPVSTVLEVDDTLSLAVKGEDINALAVQNPQMLYQTVKNLQTATIGHDTANENLDYLYKTLAETQSAAKYVYDQSTIYRSKVEYPSTDLGKHLKTIGELIISGSHTSVYYCELSGFDTHFGQAGKQGNLLKQYSDAVSALMTDLRENNRLNDVTILTFSEFGRRVEQNASGGTDHGTANNVFILNGALKKPGIYNETPDLEKLDEGDLIYRVDFRNIYATLLNRVLHVDDAAILKRRFDYLDFI